MNKKLAKEKAKLEVKKRELMKLNQKLKEVQKKLEKAAGELKKEKEIKKYLYLTTVKHIVS